MEFSDVVRARRMVRTYDPKKPVDPEVVRSLLDLAVRAPSAGFSQGWHFVVLDSEQARERFWSATTAPDAPEDPWLAGMRTAPVLILALSHRTGYLDRYAEPDKGWLDRDPGRWPVPYWDVDTGMASLLILLGAVDAGLGSCFFGVPAAQLGTLKTAFDIPTDLSIVGVVSLGHPAADRRSPSLKRGRRPQAEVVSYNRFNG